MIECKIQSEILFIDGPIRVFVDRTAQGIDIMAAYERVGHLVRVAACELQNERERNSDATDGRGVTPG